MASEGRMCECGHIAGWHKAFLPPGTAFHQGFGECKGYAGGNSTTGFQPCQCPRFRSWSGPWDARTGAPVKPLLLSTAPGTPTNSLAKEATDANR